MKTFHMWAALVAAWGGVFDWVLRGSIYSVITSALSVGGMMYILYIVMTLIGLRKMEKTTNKYPIAAAVISTFYLSLISFGLILMSFGIKNVNQTTSLIAGGILVTALVVDLSVGKKST